MKKLIVLTCLCFSGFSFAEPWTLYHRGKTFAMYIDDSSIRKEDEFLGDKIFSAQIKNVNMGEGSPSYFKMMFNCTQKVFAMTHIRGADGKDYPVERVGKREMIDAKDLNGGDFFINKVCPTILKDKKPYSFDDMLEKAIAGETID